MMRLMTIDYTLKRRKRMRNIRVRVEPTAEVVVTAPWGIPKSMIMSFVLRQSQWIEKQQAWVRNLDNENSVVNWQRGWISIKGKRYIIKYNPAIDTRVKLGQEYLSVKPVTLFKSHIPRTVWRWLKQQAERDIEERVRRWSEKMKVSPIKISFRQQKSRWGSCNRRGHLSFNWRLIHFAEEVIDYVVVHELAHLIQANHSKKFWQVVERYNPDYKKQRLFLRRQHLKLVTV